MSLIPLDRVTDLIKNLIDGIRCHICDKSFGDRKRYPCGHTGCNDCLTVAEGCVLCLTPPLTNVPAHSEVLDEALTNRVKNANTLLNHCEKTFHVDVYKRHRISEQLKVEKELFPKCIQAPVKYCNKRKSDISSDNKENQFHWSGEQISPSIERSKMKRHSTSVKHWLSENENYSRRVFSELNVNQQSITNTNKKLSESIISTRKRYHAFSPEQQLEKYTTTNKKRKNSLKPTFWENKMKTKCEHEESGIVLDDEPIYIEDSQSEIADKDRLALLAVEQAENELSDSFSLKSLEQMEKAQSPSDKENKEKTSSFNSNIVKVPFFRKSSLLEPCLNCREINVANNGSPTVEPKNVLISIANNDFITTINISNCVENQDGKKSTSIQTDACDFIEPDKNTSMEKDDNSLLENPVIGKDESYNAFHKERACDMDIFTDDFEIKPTATIDNVDKFNTSESKELKRKNVIINDSDSDTTNEESSILQVSADVHVSCEADDYGILSDIYSDQSMCRARSKVRRATPDSSNSSDKENCDPNKIKKRKGNKKIKSNKK